MNETTDKKFKLEPVQEINDICREMKKFTIRKGKRDKILFICCDNKLSDMAYERIRETLKNKLNKYFAEIFIFEEGLKPVCFKVQEEKDGE